VQNIVDANKIPGLTVAVVDKSGHVEHGAWGVNSENGTEMTTDTLFNIASCSKAFLSASLGILIDDFANGRNRTPLPAALSTLAWKSKVAHLLPDAWKLMDHWASDKASLIDILTHVSGVDSHDLSYKINSTVATVTTNLRNLRYSFELREQWLYNHQMYIVGANIVSMLSGMSYADFVKERIFKPLGMKSSTYSIDAAIKTGKFTDTWTSSGRLIPPWVKEDFADLMAGPAGLVSSVEELVPWVRMILNGGIHPDTNVTVIPPKQLDVITSPHSIMSSDVNSPFSNLVYGLGWIRFSAEGEDFLLHDGGAPGVSSLTVIGLSSGVGVVLLANADEKQEALTNITIAIGKNSLRIPPSPPARKRTVSPPQHKRRADAMARTDNIRDVSSLDMTGTYLNDGYGPCRMCGAGSSSASCKKVLSDFQSVDKSLSPNSTDLFIPWDAVFVSHIHLTNKNGTLFSVSVGGIYPKGYGKNSTAFSTLKRTPLMIDFVVEKNKVVGFGILHDADQQGSVAQSADVWYVKQA